VFQKVTRVSKSHHQPEQALRSLAQDALNIWHAGVDAVRAERVMQAACKWDGRLLTIREDRYDLGDARRIVIIGAGKACAGMLQGLVDVLKINTQAASDLDKRIGGWINVPEGSIPQGLVIDRCVPRTELTVFEARPAGINAPTERAVAGTQEILKWVESCGPDDVVLFLLSGGGSALLCAPIEGIDLETKAKITAALSLRGATIQELNSVRRCLSKVKGGGVSRRCKANTLITLMISDVLGDPLESIGSGPTIENPPPDPVLALSVLDRLLPGEFGEVRKLLEERIRVEEKAKSNAAGMDNEGYHEVTSEAKGSQRSSPRLRPVYVLANNQTAVTAAAQRAAELGYRVESESNIAGDGLADRFGNDLLGRLAIKPVGSGIVSGGEPTVMLPASEAASTSSRRGGRNLHLILSVGYSIVRTMLSQSDQTNESSTTATSDALESFVERILSGELDFAIVSGGTDGEDGNTPCAGAWIDRNWLLSHESNVSEVRAALDQFDSYGIFKDSGHLLETGPTHTNVCDLRVGLIRGLL
jgi:hydroxypyruvate reductase